MSEVNTEIETSAETQADLQPEFLAGPEAARPDSTVNRTIYYCTDSKKFFRFENSKWSETTKR